MYMSLYFVYIIYSKILEVKYFVYFPGKTMGIKVLDSSWRFVC